MDVFMRVDGQMPADPGQLPYLLSRRKTPIVVKHTADQAGKMAFFAVRYVDTDANPGPLSEVTAATIAA